MLRLFFPKFIFALVCHHLEHIRIIYEYIWVRSSLFCKWCSICDSTDLAKRTISDNILQNKAYEITKNLKHGRYQSGLGGLSIRFLIR